MEMKVFNGLRFSELTIGHMANLSDDIDRVLDVFAGNASGASDNEFLWSGFVVLAASNAIAELRSAAPRTAQELRETAENLRFGMGRADVIAALMHALYLKPATSASDPGEKKLTG